MWKKKLIETDCSVYWLVGGVGQAVLYKNTPILILPPPHIRASFRASVDDPRSNVTRVDNRAEGEYSSIRILPDKFLLNSIVFYCPVITNI